ncbi:hypothetical protein P7K49_026490 [Saguinus oedipus]|uniref:Uncharacterized protein n=1 Tax=Saguinus oedipus TaxID=9490 RepID=A0ABQ9UDD6_SAGOE|nr:hypothetical protein P7K49_026490 [Saguinus oedipus]
MRLQEAGGDVKAEKLSEKATSPALRASSPPQRQPPVFRSSVHVMCRAVVHWASAASAGSFSHTSPLANPRAQQNSNQAAVWTEALQEWGHPRNQQPLSSLQSREEERTLPRKVAPQTSIR